MAENPNALVNAKPIGQSSDPETTLAVLEGKRRSIRHENYVGSGLKLELELSSGQAIQLIIEKNTGAGLRNISLASSHELSAEDEAKLKQIFTRISETLDAMFANADMGSNQNTFDFANMSGVKDIEFTVQQDNGNIKQRLQFEKHHSQTGRKEIEAMWSRYDYINGEKEQHNLALSKQPRELALAYGQMNHQWVIDQVEAGMGILGNAHTGESGLQNRVSNFFISGVQALFLESQKGLDVLQTLGASTQDAKHIMGNTIRALTSEQQKQNMPGQAVAEGSGADKQAMNSLPDFKAHFASVKTAANRHNLTMEISQTTHVSQDEMTGESSQAQFRRLLLQYDSQAGHQEYEYKWRHDEIAINQYKYGALQKSYEKIEDLQQGLLSRLSEGQQIKSREENSHYMQRKEYRAGDHDQPALKNNYIKSNTYTDRGHSVNYQV